MAGQAEGGRRARFGKTINGGQAGRGKTPLPYTRRGRGALHAVPRETSAPFVFQRGGCFPSGRRDASATKMAASRRRTRPGSSSAPRRPLAAAAATAEHKCACARRRFGNGREGAGEECVAAGTPGRWGRGRGSADGAE